MNTARYRIQKSSFTKKYRIQKVYRILFFIPVWVTEKYASGRFDKHGVIASPIEFDTYELALTYIRNLVNNNKIKKERFIDVCYISNDGNEM